MDEIWDELARESRSVHAYFLKLTGNHALADEVTQQTLLECYRGYRKFRGDSSLSTWMISVGRRILAREKKRAPSAPLTGNEPDENDLIGRAEDGLMAGQALGIIRSLETPYSEALLLRIDGMSYREIAQALGGSENWARVTCLRARRKLMERLEGGNNP